ncbi:MAG: RNA polymerase sigma factor [Mariniblastus sp.]
MSQKPSQISETDFAESHHAFREIVLEHQATVRVFLARYIHCSQQIDDLAQEVFIACFNQLDEFRGDSKLSTWLLGIARNKALNFLRSEVRRSRNQRSFAESELIHQSLRHLDRDDNPELMENRAQALEVCLQSLPAQSKLLIKKFYFEKQTSIAIGSEMGQSDSAVRMKLKRIRGILQNCIATKLPRCKVPKFVRATHENSQNEL